MTDRDYDEIDKELTESREFECAMWLLEKRGIKPPVDSDSDWDALYSLGRQLEEAGLLLQYACGEDLRDDPLEVVDFGLEKFNR
jgi:hypothetical protein